MAAIMDVEHLAMDAMVHVLVVAVKVLVLQLVDIVVLRDAKTALMDVLLDADLIVLLIVLVHVLEIVVHVHLHVVLDVILLVLLVVDLHVHQGVILHVV